MKSQVFSIVDIENSEDFKRDIQKLVDLSPSVLADLPQVAFRAFEAPTRAEADLVRTSAAETLGVPRARLDDALDMAIFLLTQLAPKGKAENDSPLSLAQDMSEAAGLPDDKTSALVSLLTGLQAIAKERVQPVMLRKTHEDSTLPVLGSVSTCADFRAVFDEPYKYEKSVGGFSPKFMGTIPMGIIGIKLSGAHANQVFFQVSRRTLQILIDHLLALQRQIDIAERGLLSKEERDHGAE